MFRAFACLLMARSCAGSADYLVAEPECRTDLSGNGPQSYCVAHGPETVTGGRVLELGAGSGIVGIAAAKAGAREVIAAEIDRYALAALGLNSELNGVEITAIGDDLTSGETTGENIA